MTRGEYTTVETHLPQAPPEVDAEGVGPWHLIEDIELHRVRVHYGQPKGIDFQTQYGKIWQDEEPLGWLLPVVIGTYKRKIRRAATVLEEP